MQTHFICGATHGVKFFILLFFRLNRMQVDLIITLFDIQQICLNWWENIGAKHVEIWLEVLHAGH